MDFEEFLRDTKTQDAVIRNLEVLGEEVKCLPDSFKGQHPEIPWNLVAGMRDKLIHQYFGVSLDIVWNTCIYDIPPMNQYLVRIKGAANNTFDKFEINNRGSLWQGLFSNFPSCITKKNSEEFLPGIRPGGTLEDL